MSNLNIFISPEEFLSRAKAEPNVSPRIRRQHIPADAPKIERLFAAGLDQKAAVMTMLGKMIQAGVAVLFENNPKQANYAPTVRLVGSKQALLAALVVMANDYHPDEVNLYEQPTGLGTILDLWWD